MFLKYRHTLTAHIRRIHANPWLGQCHTRHNYSSFLVRWGQDQAVIGVPFDHSPSTTLTRISSFFFL